LKLLQYMAFPWRFLSLVAFGTAFVAGFPLLLIAERRLASGVTAGLLVVLLVFGLPHIKPGSYLNYTDADFSPSMILSKNLAVTSAREYQPVWVQQSPTVPSATPLSFVDGTGVIDAISGSVTNQSYTVQVTQPALLRAHTTYFPGWTLLIDGARRDLLYDRVTGEMEFALSPGSHRIELALKPTAIEAQSAMISFVALALLLLVGLSPWMGVERVYGRARQRWWPVDAPVEPGDPASSPDQDEVGQIPDLVATVAEALEPTSSPKAFTAEAAYEAAATIASAAVPVDAQAERTDQLPRVASSGDLAAAQVGGWQPVGWRVKLGIYLFFLSVYIITGAGHFYSTDHVAVYLTTQSMVEHHSLVIDPINLAVLGRGGHYYGRYGLLQSIVSIPLYLVGKTVDSMASPQMHTVLAGPNLGEWGGTVPIFFVSLLNAFVAPFTCLLMFLFALRLGFRTRVALGTTLLFGFSTLTWTYARDYFQHPLETLFLLLTAYLLFIHRDRLSVKQALWAGAPFGLAVLTRLNIAIVLPVFAGYVFLLASRTSDAAGDDGDRADGTVASIVARIKQPFAGVTIEDWPSLHVLRVLAGFLVIPIVSLLLYLGLNYYRFDTIRDPAFNNILKSSASIFVGLYGNLLSPGRSIFLYSPPLILALLGFRQFYRRFRYEALLVAGVAICYIVLYSIPVDWDGGWSWGPRYLVATIPFLMLPLGYFLTSKTRVAIATVLGVLGAAIQLLGIIINYSYVYWEWTNMHLIPGTSYLFVPGISAIPMSLRDLFAGRNVDMWLIWVYHQSGTARVIGILAIALAIMMTALFLLLDGLAAPVDAAESDPVIVSD
jgi:hypothetical protein